MHVQEPRLMHSEVESLDRSFFGHPRGLASLFGVELWERFSFYGMVTILAYYLYYSVDQGGLGLPQATATGIVGSYGALVCFSTVLGGWLADRVFGMERMVLYGGFVVMAGHVALALVPGLTGVGLGLVLVAVGAGALKANATSLLGTLYAEGDVRRDSGFNLYYLGINIGSFLGPLITGALNDAAGFHIAFGAAAIGMSLGLTQYVFFRRNLGAAGRAGNAPSTPLSATGRRNALIAAATGALAVTGVVASGIITLSNLAPIVATVVAAAAIIYFSVMLTSHKVSTLERNRVRSFIPMFVVIAAFWAMYQQIFTTLAVYSDERINWNIFGWTAPSSYLLIAETLWTFPLLLITIPLWTKLGDRAPSTPTKLGLGVVITGVAYLLFLPMAGGTGKSVPAIAVLFILIFFAVAELLVSPIALSVSTKLAPAPFRAQMMALYFFAPALGSSLSGIVAKFYTPQTEVLYFAITGGAAIIVGVSMFLATPWVRRRMEGVH